ncbi:c-type cytochrome [Pseudorhodoferax soli]|uniref:Cytochrome c553 n=1 Tax=Pseudorhodoferax soli TaxID=545864 RepID=A0A368XH17_9BURK|nr:c-type cytochrome [Pseudorhodoferax soli]RCW67290.1 cytochrome c553 [Pseudorhodoferax soli]
MRWKMMLAFAAGLAGVAAPAAAQDKDALYMRSLAATCANCHGTQGKAQPGSSVVSLAGMPAEQLTAQMAAFKAGTRSATIMHQLAKGYSDAQIGQIAAYFAAQNK